MTGISFDDFDDDFDGDALDPAVWLPHYLPMWSSRAATRATHKVRDSALHLTIAPTQARWLPGEHTPPLRVSGVQSGVRSGPVGSTAGQQSWRAGATVREEQPPFRGWLPRHGTLSMRARMTLPPGSMAAWWLVGWEEDPEECGEICVWEIFGDTVVPGVSAELGCGIKAIGDPRLTQDFAAPRLDLDVTGFHTYELDWDAGVARFAVDGVTVRSCPHPPTYPMQSMIAVFDFPDAAPAASAPDRRVPTLVVDRVSGSTASAGGVSEPRSQAPDH